MTVLREESSGPLVVSLQTKLKTLGFNPGKIDGYFGPETKDALIAFQRLKGLTADGIAGPRTISALPANGLDLPLHLFQVLEEEHIGLYGELEQKTSISLNGHAVTAHLNWNFHQGHIRDWEKFKRYLQELLERFRDRPKNSSFKAPASLMKALQKENIVHWRSEEDATDCLNRLLGQYFYNREDFKHLILGKSTEKLFKLYPNEDELHRISAEELSELNRFLLEEVFPEHLESIREVRLAAIFQRSHERPSAALSLSGGGIRSGTLALGLLQGLARHGLLKHFDYLSTVSGGGYIGAWLTAWIHRHSAPDRGLLGVTKDLANAIPGRKIDPEPGSLRHLREYSNFLTPKVGLMSADTWTFLAIYVRNLLLNWSVIIPLLLAFLLIPRLSVAVVLADPQYRWLQFLPLVIGFILVVWAISYVAVGRPRLRPLLIQHRSRFADQMGQRGFLGHCLFPLVAAGSLLTTHWAWTQDLARERWWLFPVFGGAIAATSLLVSIAIVGSWKEVGKSGAAVLILTGIVGGLLVYAGTRLLFTNLRVLNGPTQDITVYVTLAVPLFLLLFMLAATLFAGISSHLLKRVSDEDREWWARFSAWTLISAGAWVVFSSLVLFGPVGLQQFPTLLGAVGGVSGVLALVLGKSGKTPATPEKIAQGGLKAQLSSFLLPLLALLFLAIFVAALSLLTSRITPKVTSGAELVLATISPGSTVKRSPNPYDQTPAVEPKQLAAEISTLKITDLIDYGKNLAKESDQVTSAIVQHMGAVHSPRWWFLFALMVLLSGVGFGFARIVNLNLFSLHNSYRNRLIRGFLAASRDRQVRRPNPFTGFDTADNVSMHELRPALLHEVDFKNLEGFANQLKMGGEAYNATKAEEAKRASQKNSGPRAENGPAAEKQVGSAGDERVGDGEPGTASEFLYTQLSDKGKAAVNVADALVPLAERHRVDLIEDLNRILEADQIQLGKVPGFLLPPNLSETRESGQPAAPPLSQRREYHIHQNRWALEHTFPQFIEESNYPPHRLLHVVNTTLNLVGGDNLAWQQRKAESFTVSPLHCGSFRVGYRRSKDYGGDDGISLGTAMAISGAAASSNMGYYTTSPVLSLLLTLFNVRLGWWLGNPGPAGSHSYTGLKTDDRPGEASNKIYRRMSPTLSIMPVFYEAFGLTDDRNDYVYLTDGGHFENLGLYEMVLRRCNLIVVSDGAADARYEFNDLANAVRKIRIDLGIHIEFPDIPIYSKAPEKDGHGGCYWSIGLIRYSDIDRKSDGKKAEDGILIYIKPAVYEDEPEDVVHYKRTHPTFPNETTADQFFDEPQFESYRALGSYIMDQMCGSHSGDLDLGQFAYMVNKNFLRMAPQVKERYLKFWASKFQGKVT